jgi:hypothetical protein
MPSFAQMGLVGFTLTWIMSWTSLPLPGQPDGLRLSLMPASGRGIGLSVEMSITEALGLIEALPGRGGSGTASV